MRRSLTKAALASILFAGALLAVAVTVDAQQTKKIPRIGYLGVNPRSVNLARIEAFQQGLRELGYSEGKNIVIEWRSAEGKVDRLPAPSSNVMTIGIVTVASLAARVDIGPLVTMMSTLRRTSSDASAGRRQRVRGQPCATSGKHYWT